MSKEGYIKLYRQLQESWIWDGSEPFDMRSAWVDLLLMANHEDNKTIFDGEVITVMRGQRITSVRKLAERWHWGKDKTLKFLKMLEADKMIVRNADSRKTLVTIVNYAKFQSSEVGEQTVNRHSADSPQTVRRHSPATNKNDKNEKNDKKENNIYAPGVESADVEPLPLNDGTEWKPTFSEYEEYIRLFPDVDIDSEFRRMRSWCNANNKKTRNGIKRFVNAWLSRAQDNPKKSSSKTKGQSLDDYMLSVIRGEAT